MVEAMVVEWLSGGCEWASGVGMRRCDGGGVVE